MQSGTSHYFSVPSIGLFVVLSGEGADALRIHQDQTDFFIDERTLGDIRCGSRRASEVLNFDMIVLYRRLSLVEIMIIFDNFMNNVGADMTLATFFLIKFY